MGDLSPGRAVAAFDSASAMVRAVAGALAGRDFARLGQPWWQASLVDLARRLPAGARRWAYAVSGAAEGVPPRRLGDVDLDAVSGWLAGHYPRRRYPAVVVGASNGAMVHLCAAVGMPWLPQTVLVPVRRRQNDPGDPAAACAFGARVAPLLLARNPDVVLHHMHDANQDRLMVSRMAYFRLKRTRLGAAYEQFLRERLAPGAPVLVLDDRSTWPVTRVADRHLFQTGARGGLAPDDYLLGPNAPAPTEEAPEAEWGLDPLLAEDVDRWARDNGHPVHRVRVDEPETLSPVVADLHRDWYAGSGLPADRLLVESFVLLDPVQALRTGLVPFWTVFAVRDSLAALGRYLAGAGDYREATVLLFPHGVESEGIAMPDEWRDVAARYGLEADLSAVDERRFPADFGAFTRFGRDLRRLDGGGPSVGSLPLGRAVEALEAAGVLSSGTAGSR